MNQSDISRVIQAALESNEIGTGQSQRDIAFHMTDWLDDLQSWHSFCSNPESMDSDKLVELMTSFLIHVPNHLAAASKLMLDIPVADIFDVGATTDDA